MGLDERQVVHTRSKKPLEGTRVHLFGFLKPLERTRVHAFGFLKPLEGNPVHAFEIPKVNLVRCSASVWVFETELGAMQCICLGF